MSDRVVTIPLEEYENLKKLELAVRADKTIKRLSGGGYCSWTEYLVLEKDETINILFNRIAELERRKEYQFKELQKRKSWFRR